MAWNRQRQRAGGADGVCSRPKPFVGAALALLLSAGVASAQAIDLAAPLGNEAGCANRNGQEVVSDDMLLLSEDGIVTSASACTITGTRVGEGGALEIDALCEYLGEDAPAATSFTLKPSQTSDGGFVVTDANGDAFGVVSPCR